MKRWILAAAILCGVGLVGAAPAKAEAGDRSNLSVFVGGGNWGVGYNNYGGGYRGGYGPRPGYGYGGYRGGYGPGWGGGWGGGYRPYPPVYRPYPRPIPAPGCYYPW